MIRGGLFTRYFLDDGIRETDVYKAFDPARLAAFAADARALWRDLHQMRRPSEAETESVFIFPILDLLGWRHLPQQEPGRGRRDIADALLFLDDTALAKARGVHEPADRFRLGAVVVENEARDTLLDRASGPIDPRSFPATEISHRNTLLIGDPAPIHNTLSEWLGSYRVAVEISVSHDRYNLGRPCEKSVRLIYVPQDRGKLGAISFHCVGIHLRERIRSRQ